MQDLDPQHIRVTVSATDDTLARALADRIASWWNAAGSIEIRARIREHTATAPESAIAWVDLPLALESEAEEESDVRRLDDGSELGNRVQLPSEYPWVATASPDELLSQFSSESSARSFAVDVPLLANAGAPPAVLKWHSPGMFHRFVENVQAATLRPGVPPRKFVAAISILSVAVLAVLAVSSGRQLDARSPSSAEQAAATEPREDVADIELPAAVPTPADAALVSPAEQRRSGQRASASVATGSSGRTTRGITTVAAQSQEAAAGKYVAALLVTSEPSGAIVEVDGVRRGATPLRVTRLAVGSHAVQVALDGHTLWSTAARVVFGQDNRVVARLAKQAQYH
jgi:hypothetical protein